MFCPKCGNITESRKCKVCQYDLKSPILAISNIGLSNIIDSESRKKALFLEGERLYKENRFQESRSKYEEAAGLGYDKAQYMIGLMYVLGKGGTVDVEKGLKWLKASAEQGGADALKIIAYLYEKGLGVHQNYDEALRYYYQAANLGDAIAKQRIAAIEKERDDYSLRISLLTKFASCLNMFVERESKTINELLAKRERLIKQRDALAELEQQLARDIEKEEREIAQKDQGNKIRKVGPNDPCPCGSGKKYKLCHGIKPQKEEATQIEQQIPIITDKDLLLQEIALYSTKEITSGISNVLKTKQIYNSDFSENRIEILNQILCFLRQTYGNKK